MKKQVIALVIMIIAFAVLFIGCASTETKAFPAHVTAFAVPVKKFSLLDKPYTVQDYQNFITTDNTATITYTDRQHGWMPFTSVSVPDKTIITVDNRPQNLEWTDTKGFVVKRNGLTCVANVALTYTVTKENSALFLVNYPDGKFDKVESVLRIMIKANLDNCEADGIVIPTGRFTTNVTQAARKVFAPRGVTVDSITFLSVKPVEYNKMPPMKAKEGMFSGFSGIMGMLSK